MTLRPNHLLTYRLENDIVRLHNREQVRAQLADLPSQWAVESAACAEKIYSWPEAE